MNPARFAVITGSVSGWSPPLALAIALIALSEASFLLFHTAAELFSIIVAVMLFAVAWQTYRFKRDDFLMFLGCGYFWVAILDLGHTLVYKGMGVLPIESANPATQLWLAGRYFETAVLVSALLFVDRPLRRGPVFFLLGAVAAALLGAIVFGIFPEAYIDGAGLTPFKIVSEYFIVSALAAALAVVGILRKRIAPSVFAPIALSILFTIGAELCFTFYVGVYDLSNLVGHIFKIFSFWMIFVAIVRTTLAEPYERIAAEVERHRRTSTALAESERKFSAIAAGIDDVFWIASPDLREFLYVSPGSATVWGCAPENLVQSAQALIDAIHPDDRSLMTAVPAPGASPSRREYRVALPDGSVRWVEDKIVRTEPGDEIADRVIGISRDVTVRKEASMALERLNRHLLVIHFVNHTLVHATAEEELINGVCRILVEKGEFPLAWVGFVDADEPARIRPMAHFGAHGGDIERLVPGWDGSDEASDLVGKIMRTARPMVLDVAEDEDFSRWRAAAVQRDFASVALVPLSYAGEPFGVVGVYGLDRREFEPRCVDVMVELAEDLAYGIVSIRERQARIDAEAERNLEAERARNYLSIAGSIIVALDLSGRVVMLNRKGSDILGYGEDEAVGVDWFRTFVPDDGRAEAEEVFHSVIDAGSNVEYFESEITGRDGDRHIISWHCTPVRDPSGQIVGSLESGEDITERREIERQLWQSQKIESLGNLAAGIAHDFNNLLLPIVALTGRVAKTLPAGNEDRDRLDKVLDAAARAKDLANKILVFSREDDPKLTRVDLLDVVENSMALLHSTIPTNIVLRSDIDRSIGRIKADPAQLQSVLLNLAANAAYAVGGRNGHIDIEVSRSTDDGRHAPCARIVVRDDGMGIPSEKIQRIFDPYFSTKPPGEGTGLGLAMAQSIITRLGGTISVESELGAGTAFEILLPIAESETIAAA